ncbi:MAG: hypothetical protein ABI723_02100 [Bacteroidia bacterium]
MFPDCLFYLASPFNINPKTVNFFQDDAGCRTKGTNDYTRRCIYADDPASTLIIEDNNGNPTKVYDADTSLNLSNGTKYHIINCDFRNNSISIYFYNFFILWESETPQSVPSWLWILIVAFLGWDVYYFITSFN